MCSSMNTRTFTEDWPAFPVYYGGPRTNSYNLTCRQFWTGFRLILDHGTFFDIFMLIRWIWMGCEQPVHGFE